MKAIFFYNNDTEIYDFRTDELQILPRYSVVVAIVDLETEQSIFQTQCDPPRGLEEVIEKAIRMYKN